jgi:hypothetical protein
MRAIRSLMALAGVLALLSGCAFGWTAATNSVRPPDKPPLEAIKFALSELDTMPYSYDLLTDGFTVQVRGGFDTAKKSLHYQVYKDEKFAKKELKVYAEYVVIGPDNYLWDSETGRTTNEWPKDKWLHFDARRAPKFDVFASGQLKGGFAAWPKGILSAERTGVNTYKGRFDLTKINATPEKLKRFPDGGKSVPFEAATDTRGLLSQFRYTTPAQGTLKETRETIWIRDKGVPLELKVPDPKITVPATQRMYDLFK